MLTPFEAHRQYQDALERRRRARTIAADTVSLTDELDAIDQDVAQAEAAMYDAWVHA